MRTYYEVAHELFNVAGHVWGEWAVKPNAPAWAATVAEQHPLFLHTFSTFASAFVQALQFSDGVNEQEDREALEEALGKLGPKITDLVDGDRQALPDWLHEDAGAVLAVDMALTEIDGSAGLLGVLAFAQRYRIFEIGDEILDAMAEEVDYEPEMTDLIYHAKKLINADRVKAVGWTASVHTAMLEAFSADVSEEDVALAITIALVELRST